MDTPTSASPVHAVLNTILRPQVLRITALVLGGLAALTLGIVAMGTHAGGEDARASAQLGWGQASAIAAMFGVVTRIWILSTLGAITGTVLAVMDRMLAAACCLLGSAIVVHWLLGGMLRATDAADILWVLLPLYLAGALACGAHYLTLHPFAMSVPEPKSES